MTGYDYEGPSFPARDDAGNEYVLTPLYRLKPVPQGWERNPDPAYLVRLRTERWQWVAREGKGRYRITDVVPEKSLTSDHADAV